MISEFNSRPNRLFEESFQFEIDEFVEEDDGNYTQRTINGTQRDPFNNQYIGDARAYSDAIEASGNIDNYETIKYEKAQWYISYKPLPEVIATNKNVLNDLVSCAAKSAIMTIPLLKLKPVKQEDKYSNVELNYSGYGASAAVCSAPLMYDKLYHKSTTIKDYSCTTDKLPFV